MEGLQTDRKGRYIHGTQAEDCEVRTVRCKCSYFSIDSTVFREFRFLLGAAEVTFEPGGYRAQTKSKVEIRPLAAYESVAVGGGR